MVAIDHGLRGVLERLPIRYKRYTNITQKAHPYVRMYRVRGETRACGEFAEANQKEPAGAVSKPSVPEA